MTKQKKLVQYTLTKIDKYIKRQHGDKINYNLMTIEHILPQNPLSSKEDDKLIGQLGNLVYITDSLNGRLGNKEFKQKKHILTQAHLVVDEILERASQWGETEIKERTDNFANLAFNKIFRI